jgi:GTPase
MLEKETLNFEKTVIVGVVTQKQSEEKLLEYLDELEFLTFTAGGQVVKRFFQKMDKPNPKTFLGTGKIEELIVMSLNTAFQLLFLMMNYHPHNKKIFQKLLTVKY